jgi:hypothetical protein
LKAAFNETVGSLFSEIQGRVYAIRMLTTDSEIVDPAEEINTLLSAHIADSELTYEWERDARHMKPTYSEEQKQSLVEMAQRLKELPEQLQAATEKLLTNGTEKFAIMDRRR